MPENDNPAAGTDAGAPAGTSPPPTVVEQLLRALVLGTRTLLVPLASTYAHPAGASEPGGEPSSSLPPTALTPAELATLGRATNKLVLESGELLLKSFPATPDGSRVEIARDANGNFPEPTLAYLVAAAKGISHFLDARAAKLAQQADAASGATPTVTISTAAGPLPVNFLRMQAARPASSRIQPGTVSQRMNIMPIGSSASPFQARYTRASAAIVQPSPASAVGRSGGCGCGCGGSSVATTAVATPCRPAPAPAPPAQCGAFTISCDTKNQLAACLKVALCDLLRALGQEVCGPTLSTNSAAGRVLRAAACSLFSCLPETLCPPPVPALPPAQAGDCCNFAVEEVAS